MSLVVLHRLAVLRSVVRPNSDQPSDAAPRRSDPLLTKVRAGCRLASLTWGCSPGRVRWDRAVSDAVVVSLGGQRSQAWPLCPEAAYWPLSLNERGESELRPR